MTWILNDNDQAIIDLALKEDVGLPYRDVTTQTLFSGDKHPYRVEIVSKQLEPIVFCGELVMSSLLKRLTDDVTIQMNCPDGSIVKIGESICTLTADADSLMMGERTILNFLRHLCAVATMTHQFVQAVSGTQLKILDTRKTMPGLRHLEKYAVYCGGGVNHRMGLYDAIMIKDNHVDLMGGMEKALQALPEQPECSVIVEVRTQDDLKIVLDQAGGRVTRVLLDNMTPRQLAECVQLCAGKISTEASGNLSLDVIKAVADSGVDFASVGALTHSSGNVDLSMRAIR